MGDVNPTEQMRKVSLNLGVGEDGGGSHDRPLLSNTVSNEATDRAAGDGRVGVWGICCPRRCLIGDPTHSCREKKLHVRKGKHVSEIKRERTIFFWVNGHYN